ncbi:MAG: phage tail protein, partial [Bacteroidota bacterium]
TGLLIMAHASLGQTADPLPEKDPSATLSGFSEIAATSPVGSVLAFPAERAPVGYLLCDGRTVSSTDYPELYAVLGTTYGGSASQFRLPDYRGYFLRGWDIDRSDELNRAPNDPDRTLRTNRGDGTTGNYIGTRQTYEIQSHSHGYTDKYWRYGGSGVRELVQHWNSQYAQDTKNTAREGGNETRPKNIAVAYFIKATSHEVIAGNLAVGTNVLNLNERLRVSGKAVLDSTEIAHAAILGNTGISGDLSLAQNLEVTGDLTYSDTQLAFKSDYATVMTLLEEGRVGIGTPSPEHALQVKGTIDGEVITGAKVMADTLVSKTLVVDGLIRAIEFEMTPEVWPDYVFDETYDLRPLEEVEAFIARHHHLPNVPSQEEVRTNGLRQNAFNVALLEKVEELTLYVVQLHREKEALKETLAEIKRSKK